MKKVTIDDLVKELDNALQVAKEITNPSAMIAATMSKAKLLGLDRVDAQHDPIMMPVAINVQVVDARKIK